MFADTLSAAARLARADAVLLDFDGPICSLFAGYPAGPVARELRERLQRDGVALPPGLAQGDDPHALLAGFTEARRKQGESEAGTRLFAGRLNDWLAAAELEAVASAEETPGALEALEALVDASRAVAIVSNNAAAAVVGYLRGRTSVAEPLAPRVFGRLPDPALMKPDPTLLRSALAALDVAPGRAVLIGDAVTDAEAADRAGVGFIGFAGGSERRRKRLVDVGVADAHVVDKWSDLGVLSVRQ